MRLTRLALLLLLVCGGGCAIATSTPLLSDAERCARFGGGYSHGTCRTGAP